MNKKMIRIILIFILIGTFIIGMILLKSNKNLEKEPPKEEVQEKIVDIKDIIKKLSTTYGDENQYYKLKEEKEDGYIIECWSINPEEYQKTYHVNKKGMVIKIENPPASSSNSN